MAKTPRPAKSYRAQRRNARIHSARAKKLVNADSLREFKGKWECYPDVDIIRKSFVRRWPSKYMPHTGGGKFTNNIKKQFRKVAGPNSFRGGNGRNR